MTRFLHLIAAGKRSIRLAVACALLGAPFTALAQIHPGPSGELVECTYASLHEGSCAEATPDRVVAITDAYGDGFDRCAAGSRGDGDAYVVCRYDGDRWLEFGASPVSTPTVMGGLAPDDVVLDILNPPAGSGLTPPVGDGIDGEPNARRTNDAPAITAAIQYACDNGYDVAYLGPGAYRIGAPTGTSFYTGIRIDASECPGGIKFYGAGVGRTLLLANGEVGQYFIFTTDKYNDPVSVRRIGWNTNGHESDPIVTNITTGVTPPVVTASGESYLEDGDLIHMRNCSGATQANERRFRVNACTHSEPFSCELQDEFGVDVDASEWDAWTDETPCIAHKLNDQFRTEIAYMTIRDDEPTEHMNIVCNPLCSIPGEESHGIGILQGGGVVEVHDIVIDKVGDEGIDISAPESPTYVHDVTILNAEHGGTPVYQGVGVRIEDVWVHKDEASPWIDNVYGSTRYPPYTAGDAFEVAPGSKNWRVVDLHVNRVVMTGLLGTGFGVYSNATGRNGQYVSGVKVTNSIVSLIPNELHCNGTFEICGAFRIHVKPDGYPVENIEISNNVMTGTGYMELAAGAGGVLVKDNVFTPIETISPKWGILAAARAATIEDNVISGFERGCISYQPYVVAEDERTISTTIQRNELRCISNPTTFDPMIGTAGGDVVASSEAEAGYFRIVDNRFSASASESPSIRQAVKITGNYKNVEVCRNQIVFDPAIDIDGSTAIWSESDDQLICDNEIVMRGSGIRVEGDRSKVVRNVINGFNADFATGIALVEASESLAANNVVTNFRHAASSGIELRAEIESQSGNQIVGNDIDPAGTGIKVNGGGFGFDEIFISGNSVDLGRFTPANAISLNDATNVRVTGNDLTGLDGFGVNALITTGFTDSIFVRDNLAEGGGTLKFGATGGDETCDPDGGVGLNSTCSDNEIR